MAFQPHDVVPDSPINNFATLNPLNKGNDVTLSKGNLKATTSTTNGTVAVSNIGVSTGKWYMEGRTDGLYLNIGIIAESIAQSVGPLSYLGGQTNSWCYAVDGNIYNNGSPILNTGTTYGTNDVAGLLLDLDSGNLYFFKNGNPVYSGNAVATGLSGTYYLGVGSGYSTKFVNFGQDPTFGGATNLPAGAGSHSTDTAGASTGGSFAFQPPAGAKALCTKNIPEGPIKLSEDQTPSDHFKAVTYTGNNTVGHQISDVGFKSDLIWIKTRDVASQHVLIDSVRGHDRELFSSKTNPEQNPNTSGHVPALSAITDDGFTLNQNVNPTGSTNGATRHIAWCWKAGGALTADNTATSGAMTANSVSVDGTLQSNYTPSGSPTIYPKRMSVNTKAGFSIVKYVSPNPVVSNPSVPHGLDEAPEFVIIKRTSSACNWVVKHVSYNSNANNTLRLDTTDDIYADSYNWGGNQVTDSVVPLGNYSNSDTNKPGETNIMYCWHSVSGYSKFGSYVGNGSTDGPYIDCGFRVGWLMVKDTAANNWNISDSARNPYNPSTASEWKRLLPDEPIAEQSGSSSGYLIDFLSSGFKIKGSGAEANGTGRTFIFMAFAEQPFSGPSNAR